MTKRKKQHPEETVECVVTPADCEDVREQIHSSLSVYDQLLVAVISRLRGKDDLTMPTRDDVHGYGECVTGEILERFPHLADRWDRLSEAERVPWLEKWLRQQKPGAKRIGRRRKTETPADTKIIAALVYLEGQDSREPPKGKEITEGTGKSQAEQVSEMTVSRFIKKHFGNRDVFEARWRKGEMKLWLLKIQGLIPHKHVSMDESDSAEDE